MVRIFPKQNIGSITMPGMCLNRVFAHACSVGWETVDPVERVVGDPDDPYGPQAVYSAGDAQRLADFLDAHPRQDPPYALMLPDGTLQPVGDPPPPGVNMDGEFIEFLRACGGFSFETA